jgi:fluoroquinolone transport system permease protein
MRRFGPIARVDALLAWRRGIVAAAAIVAIVYVILLRLIPAAVAETLLPFLVFSDPAALGFFFVGGTILADRADGTAAAVAVTPADVAEILAGRVVVLAGLGALGAAVVAAGSGLDIAWWWFVPAVLLSSVVYTCFGYAVAMRARSVNEYFARAVVWSIPMFVPIVVFAVAPTWPGLAAFPTTASLLLLLASAGGPVPAGTTAVAAFVVLAGSALAAAGWARTQLAAARREGRG